MRHVPSSHGRKCVEGASLACAALSSLLVLCVGCAVDDRTLSASGAVSGSGSSAGEPGGAGSPGDSGGAAGEAPLPHCLYSGTRVEQGCETLVENAGFTLNVASWAAENIGISESWAGADANADETSGSLVVKNDNFKKDEEAKGGSAPGGSRQCVPATAGRTYDLAADVFIPDGQGAGFEGDYVSSASLSVFFYPAAGCTAQTITSFSSEAVQSAGEWLHVEGSTKAPKETQAMAVRLATLKPFRQMTFEARFDNVFVRER